MNYQSIYNALIEKASSRPIPDGYTERHHIIPKSLGGSNHASNLVHLTAREHFIAHLLLAKIHGGPMIAAAWLLMNITGTKVSGRRYEWLKEAFAERQSHANTGKKHSDATRQKIGEVQKGKKLSEETKRKMSESQKGKPKSDDHIGKVAEANRGRKHTDEARKNMSEAKLGEKNNRYGVKQSDETITKRVEKLKGQKRSDEAKQRMSAWTRTDEMKARMSAAHKGKPSPMAGKYHDAETKEKMSAARKGKPWSEARRLAYLAGKEVKS